VDSKLIQTSVEDLYRELEEIKTKLPNQKAIVARLKEEVEAAKQKRDELNAEVKKLSTQTKEFKAKRDELNIKVRELKQKRDELRGVASQKRQMLSKLLEQASKVSEQLQGNMSELSKQIHSLEWYIQTNPLAPQTERNIIAKIGSLESKLVKHKELKTIRDKLLNLKVEVGALRIQAQTSHEQLTKFAEESEKLHVSMHEFLGVLKEKKKEADLKHSEFIAKMQQRAEAIGAMKKSIARMEEIKNEIGKVKSSAQIEKGERLKLKYRELAEQKMRTGEKLSFEEFQALMADTGSDSDGEDT